MADSENYWDKTARRRISRRGLLKGAVVTGAGVALAGVVGCGGGDNTATTAPTGSGAASATSAATATPKAGGDVHTGMPGPAAVDPFLAVSGRTQFPANFYYSRFFTHKVGPDIDMNSYSVVPDIAASSEQPDAQTLIMGLRQNVKWHNIAPVNGRAFTAEDAKFSLDQFVGNDKYGNNALLKGVFDSATVTDPTTLKVTLKSAYRPILDQLAAPYLVRIVAKEVLDKDGDFNKTVAGTGPFMLDLTKDFNKDQGMTLRKNPNFYIAGQPYVDTVDYKFPADFNTMMALIIAKSIDITIPMSFFHPTTATVDTVRSQTDATILPFLVPSVTDLWMNIDSAPFNDDRVRQAISMGIDRESLLQTAYSGKGKWDASIPAGLKQWWLDPSSSDFGTDGQYFKHDPQAARALLSAAGAENITADLLVTNAFGPAYDSIYQLVAQQLADIGVTANLTQQPYTEWITNTAQGKMPAGTMAAGLTTAFLTADEHLFFHYNSTSARRRNNVNDPTLDGMITDSRTKDGDAYITAVKDIQKYLATKMYILPLVSGEYYHVVQSRVKGAYSLADIGIGRDTFSILSLS